MKGQFICCSALCGLNTILTYYLDFYNFISAKQTLVVVLQQTQPIMFSMISTVRGFILGSYNWAKLQVSHLYKFLRELFTGQKYLALADKVKKFETQLQKLEEVHAKQINEKQKLLDSEQDENRLIWDQLDYLNTELYKAEEHIRELNRESVQKEDAIQTYQEVVWGLRKHLKNQEVLLRFHKNISDVMTQDSEKDTDETKKLKNLCQLYELELTENVKHIERLEEQLAEEEKAAAERRLQYEDIIDRLMEQRDDFAETAGFLKLKLKSYAAEILALKEKLEERNSQTPNNR